MAELPPANFSDGGSVPVVLLRKFQFPKSIDKSVNPSGKMSQMQTLALNRQFIFLSPMQDVHPPDGLSIADLAQIDLGRLKVLMSQNDLGDYLQWYSVSAGVRG